MYFSKSKYTGLWQCPKIAWLNKYKSEEKVLDSSTLARMSAGNEVGDLAMQLFGDYKEVTSYKIDGSLDLNKMKQLTLDYINEGVENICEASFEYKGLYCACDILRKEEDGYSIYEVKSSTHEDNYIYIVDISYQKYVLEKCGIKIINTFLINVDSSYVRGDELDIQKLFKITKVSKEVDIEISNVESLIEQAIVLLDSKEEPNIDLSINCNNPYKCSYFEYCTKHLPKPNIFDLYRLPFNKKIDNYKKGIISYDSISNSKDIMKNPTRNRVVNHYLNDLSPYIEKDNIEEYLATLSYPLYFLDFETMQPVIPLFKGTSPYQQIVFQYSLHYIEEKGGEIKHKEFLAVSGEDPRRAVAESLVANIPADVCVLAYNKAFERGRLEELAETFEDLAIHLRAIKDNMKDLLDPFQKGMYYKKEMGNSFSIKSVLPALFPNDPSLNYKNLEGVHNGGEAMSLFPKIKDMDINEQQIARKNLLKYCELDTFAMVKIYLHLLEICEKTKV